MNPAQQAIANTYQSTVLATVATNGPYVMTNAEIAIFILSLVVFLVFLGIWAFWMSRH